MNLADRLLVCNHFPVVPPHCGGMESIFQLYAHMALLRPVDYTVLAKQKAPCQRSHMAFDFAQVSFATTPLDRRLTRILDGETRGHGLDFSTVLRAHRNETYVDWLRRQIVPGRTVIMTHPFVWWAVRQAAPEAGGFRLVYDSHNIEFLLKKANIPDTRVGRFLLGRLRALEADLCRHAQLIYACTDQDAATMQAEFSVAAEKIVVQPKGIAVRQYAAYAPPAERVWPERPRALFLGADHPPNNDAARHIAEHLAPRFPGVDFLIMGKCHKGIPAAARPANVHVLDFVWDRASIMTQCQLALNPVESGSGINMKIMDYLGAGLPVLGTPFGMRGVPGTGLADDPVVAVPLAELPAALAALLDDADGTRRRGQAAQALARQRYDWQPLAAAMLGTIDTLPWLAEGWKRAASGPATV